MLKGLQCIEGQFRTEVAILKFSRERFTFVSLRILKHGDPVGDQRFVSLFYYIYLNKLCLSSTSNDVVFPLKPSRKFATTLLFLVANK